MSKTESDQSPLTPGQLLLNARKEQDISVETIARGLRLDPLLIDALENDEYEKFPAMAYVRGYLRGYANQVGIDANLLVSSFDKKINVAPTLEPFASRPEQQADSGDKHVRAVTYSLIGVLVLLVGLWWQTQRAPSVGALEQADHEAISDEYIEEQDDVEVLEGTSGQLGLTPLVSLSSEEDEIEEPKELEHEFAVIQMNPLPEPPSQTSDPESLSEESQKVEEEKLQEEPSASSEEPTSTASSELEETSKEESEETSKEESEETSKEESEETSKEESETEKVEAKEEGIVLKFSDESWIQITDASGKKRFSRAGKAGEVVNVAGQQPFKVIIGKSSVVKMNYKGNAIDLNSLSKDEVARFYIDKDGAHK